MTEHELDWKEISAIAETLKKNDQQYKPDKWQDKVLEHEGNIALRTGRQVGKSATIARKCADLAINNEGITILMIAAAQRQSSEIFQKTLAHVYKINDSVLEAAGGFKPRPQYSAQRNMERKRRFEAEHGIFVGTPTRTEFTLKNNVRVLSLPTGKSGAFVRCYTVDILIADEAAYIPEPVWIAVRPMLATSQKTRGFGWEILLSTPFGKGGHYYNCCHDPDYLQIHVTSEQCPRISKDFLRKERKKLSKLEYAQEYLGEFIAEYNQLFSTALIKERSTFIDWQFDRDYRALHRYYLGVDIARYGADENAFVIGSLDKNNHLRIVKILTTERKSLADTVGRVLKLHQQFDFRKIFTDDSGVGGGVTDFLIEKLGTHKIMPINNATRSVQEKNKGIMKEDLYSNALTLLERKHVDLISDLKLQRSLKSITFEYTSNANLRIYGNYSHIAEAFVRCCWCVKTKGLKLYLA